MVAYGSTIDAAPLPAILSATAGGWPTVLATATTFEIAAITISAAFVTALTVLVLVQKKRDGSRRAVGIPRMAAMPRPRPLTDTELATADEPFRKIGGQFTVGKQAWVGPVVASPDAIYLFKVTRPNSSAAAGGAVGGIVGALAAHAIEKAFRKPDDAPTLIYADLPAAVTAHPAWPARKVKPETPVVIARRNEIDGIFHPSLSNHLTFSSADVGYLVQYSMGTGAKVRKHFERHRWPLDWIGSVQ